MPSCSSSAQSQGSYMEVKREMEQLINSKDQLHRAELHLESEKAKGRWLLAMCVMMILFCSVIFMDQIPNDLKESLINYLEKGGKTSEMESNKVDDPHVEIMPQPSSGNETERDSYRSSVRSLAPTQVPITKARHGSQSDYFDEDKLLVSILDKRIEKLSVYNRWNIPFISNRETPVYWHVPRTAGIMVDEIFSHCYKLVQAVDNVGVLMGHETDTSLQMISNEDGGKYINVNMGTKEGIDRGKKLKLTTWSSPFVIRTPYLFETAGMFHPGRSGKCFAVLRNPIERAIDVFQHLKDMKKPVFVNMTMEEYTQSPYCEQNWMVRILSDEMKDVVSQEHLDMAKHVLGRKCIVGFTERLEESVHRFAKYFKWDQDISKLKIRDCLSNLLSKDSDANSSSHISPFNWQVPVSEDPKYGKGSLVWEMLKKKNSLDIELYNYAKKLFQSQALYFARL
eukprot:CAMPEP_0198262930 /NCGR_PEP_ID=MMETSP1447-20131203/11363_1 /TAXON_ID=420782 /ORGANISM="Chaetoceros dichaeta, Strain CCMP1751" /LENGTH=452 /DNA_ID=CAMNT_0043951351 /DNA_START=308 /DNA_END=1666 /DNA_ORIENTATION=+